jgi:TonB family protein
VAEPVVPDSGQRAFCSDEGGVVRASADGKASSCLSGGEVVEKATAAVNQPLATPQARGSAAPQGYVASGAEPPAERVRISRGVAGGLIINKVNPVYPEAARAARVQGTVVLKALINKQGDIVRLDLVDGHPLLAPAAIDAVKEWKYRPYLLNGKAVAAETEITVNFALSDR